MAIRTGRFTITLPSRPVVQGFAAVAGKKEGEGPLAAEFDHIFDDTTLGEVSWEKAESKLHREAVIRALSKAQKSPADVDVIFAGDLLSQCIGTCFGIRELDMPFAGLYGACSTMALSLLMASVFIDTGTAGRPAPALRTVDSNGGRRGSACFLGRRAARGIGYYRENAGSRH